MHGCFSASVLKKKRYLLSPTALCVHEHPLQKSSSRTSVLVRGVGQPNGAERPRLVQTQCWYPRDVRRGTVRTLVVVYFV